MYNLNGILHRIKFVGLPILLLGAIVLLIGILFKSPHKSKTILIGIAGILFALVYSAFYFYKYSNPTISVYEGEFLYENRSSRATFNTHKYIFFNENGSNPSFFLDSLTKKDIYDPPFAEGAVYRIYYEETTKIIVYIELIE